MDNNEWKTMGWEKKLGAFREITQIVCILAAHMMM